MQGQPLCDSGLNDRVPHGSVLQDPILWGADLMARALMDQIFVRSRRHGFDMPPALHDVSAPLIWLHADHARTAQILTSFSQTLLQRAPHVTVLLTAPEFPEDLPKVAGRVELALPADSVELARTISERITPSAALVAAQVLPCGVIRVLGDKGVPVFIAETPVPRFASRWQQMPGVARRFLAHVETVFVPSESSARAWGAVGLAESAILRSGRLSGIPVALGCNETEREELAENFRHRTLWLATALPEREEAAVLAAHHEALRESHRLALILQPADPARGAELRKRCATHFVTALRSEDDPVSPETQVYIADTEGERGLWYRLAVTCYLGGTLGGDGATLNPLEAAALGCALVHGRMYGRYSEAFDMLREARATRMIQSAEALGAAICTALRPEQAADQAHRAWQVISSGAEATDTVIAALLAKCPGPAE